MAEHVSDTVHPYNPAITVVKLAAWAGILLFHLQLFPLGTQGTVMFVICSGYGYHYLYQKRGGRQALRLFLHQAEKLFFAVLLVYLLMLLAERFLFGRGSFSTAMETVLLVSGGAFAPEVRSLANYLLPLVGINVQLQEFPAYNAPLWFVSLLLWLYLFFPLLLPALESRFRMLWLVVFFCMNAAVMQYSPFADPANSISANLLYFYAGMLLYRCEPALFHLTGRQGMKTAAAVCLALPAALFGRGAAGGFAVSGVVGFFSVYLLFSEFPLAEKIGGKRFQAINALIMFLYMLHFPLLSLWEAVRLPEAGRQSAPAASYGLYLLLLLSSALAVNVLYRAMRRGCRAGDPRP